MSKRSLPDRVCPTCDTTFRPKRTTVRYCSRECWNRKYLPRGTPCTVPGCDKPIKGRNLCAMHWARWRKHGSTDLPHRPTYTACQVTGCARTPRSSSNPWCETHYYRLRRRGTLELLGPEQVERTCTHCDESFTGTKNAKFCSRTCKQRHDAHHYQRRVRADNDRDHITTDYVGNRDNWCCHLCGKRINQALTHPHKHSATIDHLVPLSLGGLHRLENVAIAHSSCNKAKGNRAANEQLLLLG